MPHQPGAQITRIYNVGITDIAEYQREGVRVALANPQTLQIPTDPLLLERAFEYHEQPSPNAELLALYVYFGERIILEGHAAGLVSCRPMTITSEATVGFSSIHRALRTPIDHLPCPVPRAIATR